MRIRMVLMVLALVGQAACEAENPSADRGEGDGELATTDALASDAGRDGGRPDAAPPDSATPDAAQRDAAQPDAAQPDAMPLDAAVDAAQPDAEPLDAEAPDAALPPPVIDFNEVQCRGGEFIELFIREGGDLTGWQVTDDPVDPERGLELPAAVAESGQRLLLVELPFGIACDETITLLSPARVPSAMVRLREPREAASWGRLPDAIGDWTETAPTPGAENAPLPPAAVALNEVDCQGREFIEVINIGESPADLRGWTVSDSADEQGHPLDDLVLAPGEIGAVRRQTADAAGFTFGIGCGADEVRLLDPEGRIRDRVEVPRQPRAYTWGRLPDGEGEWTATDSTRGEPNRLPAAVSEAWFSPPEVVELHFEVDQAGLEALGESPRTYVAASMRAGEGEALPVGLRLKGRAGSFRTLDRKSAFKVKIDWEDDDAQLFGQRRLTLNNMVQDRSLIHEWTAYTIFRAMGVAAPRVGYAWVTLNGEPYGLYSNIEALEDELLDRWFHRTAHLYEGAYGADLFPDHVNRFDRDEGDEDRGDLIDLITLMHAVEPDLFYASSGHAVDWAQALAMMVTEIYIGHWDGYAPTRNNYYLHFDDEGVVRLMPWGTDQTFSRHLPLREGRGLLLERCRMSPDCMEAFDRTLIRVVETVDELALIPQIEALALGLRAHAEADPRRDYDMRAIDGAVQGTIDFLLRRRDEVGVLVDCLTADDPDPDGDGFICDQDCDPDDPTIWPGAPEICGDEIDQDCNGYVDDDPRCPDCTEYFRDGHRYLVCTTPRPYEDAIARCREHGAEGWVPDGPAEAVWVLPLALAERNQDYWIGLDDLETEGTFAWPDGVERPWTNWNGGEPNNSGSREHCAHIWARNGRWNDLPCDRRLGIICEDACDPATDADQDGANGCGEDCADDDAMRAPELFDVCNDGIDQDCNGELDDGEGCVPCAPVAFGPHVYQVCTGRLPYAEARAWCVEMGSDLAVLADPSEARAVAEAAQAVRAQQYYIGLNDLEAEGTFRWVDGREVAPDSPWNGGEPNDYNNNEDCAHILGDRPLWNDLPCDSAQGFICEPICPEAQDTDGDGILRCEGDCDDDDPEAGRCVEL